MTAPTTFIVDFRIWEDRWQALNKSIDNYKNRLDQYISETDVIDTRIMDLRKTLDCFQEFASMQFHFFYNGFAYHYCCPTVTSTLGNYNLALSAEYPPEHALDITLKQIAYDLEVIQRAAEQRIWASGDIKTTLKVADKLVEEAIEKAYKVIEGNKPIAVTYFEKSHSVRVFPYAQIALIAVPFTCVPYIDKANNKVQVTRDYLALLHELGHYVFWHGKIMSGNKEIFIYKFLYEALKNMKNHALWCYQWAEEIFADVFGCLMGGPLIALDFQDMALVTNSEEFTEDDQEHPIPALRPIIYIETLNRIGEPWQRIVGLLRDRWSNRKTHAFNLNDRNFKLTKKTAQSDIAFFEIVSKIKEVIDRIFEMLGIQTGTYPSISLAWSGDTEKVPDGSLETLYRNFQEYIDNSSFQSKEPKPHESSGQYTRAAWIQWVSDNEFLADKLSDLDAETTINPSEEVSKDTFKGWLNILYAGGWATKGPTTNPSVK